MKCNQSLPGFELVLPCPFPTTITITPRAPLVHILHDLHVYIFLVSQSLKNRPFFFLNHSSLVSISFACIRFSGFCPNFLRWGLLIELVLWSFVYLKLKQSIFAGCGQDPPCCQSRNHLPIMKIWLVIWVPRWFGFRIYISYGRYNLAVPVSVRILVAIWSFIHRIQCW